MKLKVLELRLVLFQEFKELLKERETEFHVGQVKKEFLEQDNGE